MTWAGGRFRATETTNPAASGATNDPDQSQLRFLASEKPAPSTPALPITPATGRGRVGVASALMGLAGRQGLMGLWYFGLKQDGT